MEGNQRVTEEEILRALEKNGVGLGTFGIAMDTEDIRNHVLLDIPELVWITVRVSGCRATVEVREREEVPEPVNERAPANVVARRDGLVLEVRALDGVKCVLPGTSVEAGELLISGVEDTETVGARLLAGMGEVRARTWYSLTARMPLTQLQKRYTGEERRLHALVLGGHRVKFFADSSIPEGNYDKITERTQWSLLGIPLPVTTVTEDVPDLRDGPRRGPRRPGGGAGRGHPHRLSPHPGGPLRHRQLYSVHLPPGGRHPGGDPDGGVRGADRRVRAHLHGQEHTEETGV